MLARIDWLNNGIDLMLLGKTPLTPAKWGIRDSLVERDVNLLQQAAELNSLRENAAQPNQAFIARLRKQMLLEAIG